MLDLLGPLHGGKGMLLEDEEPATFGSVQDAAMAFQVIVHAEGVDSGGELRWGIGLGWQPQQSFAGPSWSTFLVFGSKIVIAPQAPCDV